MQLDLSLRRVRKAMAAGARTEGTSGEVYKHHAA